MMRFLLWLKSWLRPRRRHVDALTCPCPIMPSKTMGNNGTASDWMVISCVTGSSYTPASPVAQPVRDVIDRAVKQDIEEKALAKTCEEIDNRLNITGQLHALAYDNRTTSQRYCWLIARVVALETAAKRKHKPKKTPKKAGRK